MGAPNQALLHSSTDRLAALLKLDLAGYDTELVSAASASLWNQVDASTDPAVVNALGLAALQVDNQSLPENYQTALGTILARPYLRNFVAALNALIISPAGGSYASMEAYLEAISATLHPMAAELFRAVLGDTAFTAAGDITQVFAPNYQSRAADRIYTGADGALVDDTVDAASSATADVALFATNGHNLYIGSRYQFAQLVIALSTLANVTPAYTVSYWNGNAWVAVTGLADSSAGLTRNDVITWTLPSPGQWVRTAKDAGGNAFADQTPLYYIKLTRTAGTLATPPVGTCIRIVPEAVLFGAAQHLGVDQPPLALIRITAADTIAVLPKAGVDFSRFKEPGLRMRALTPIGGTVTLTLSYVDQAGADQTQVQSGFASPAALATAAMALVGSGARSVKSTGNTATTGGATSGVIEVYAAEARTPAL